MCSPEGATTRCGGSPDGCWSDRRNLENRGKPSLDKGEVSRPCLLAIMPITLHIDPKKGWLEINLIGDLAMHDVTKFMGELREHPDYTDDLSGLIDCRQMTNVLDFKEVRDLADLATQRPGPAWRSRRAVLVSSGAHYSLGRMFTIFAESSPVQYDVFYNLETAMQWLKE
jgi:hypothetical protein